MSPTIPILSALLLSLISGSTESGQRMDSVTLFRQTLRYWRKIYKTYHEEVVLGYCWADYLLEISDELSTNLSASSLTATRDCNTTTVKATKSQRNPFPQNAMDTMMPLIVRETRKGKRLREKLSHTTARSAISRFTNFNDSDEHRIVSRVKMIQEKWMMNKVLPIISNNEKSSKTDGIKRITSMVDLHIQKKRQALPIVPELFHDQRKVLRDHEFSSREMRSNTVNPMPNSKYDNKISFESTDLEKNKHRKVLYSYLTNQHDSLIQDNFVPQNLSLLAVSRERSLSNHRFRYYLQSRKKNSKVDELLSDPWTPEKGHGIKRDSKGDRIPLNNYGSSLSSRLQFRWINAVAVRCTGIVKSTNSVGNSSCNPERAINSEVFRQKPEELSRDSLLLPRGKRVGVAERLPLESRGSGREAVKRNAISRFGEIAGESDTKERRYQQSRVEKRLRIERDVSAAPARIHPFFLSGLKQSHQQMLYENRVLLPIPTIAEGSKQDDDRIRAVKSAPSLPRVERFIENYENTTSGSTFFKKIQDSRLTALQARQLSLRSVIITVFTTLGIFVQVGRQIMDVVESNAILACTKEYLWTKIVKWIDE